MSQGATGAQGSQGDQGSRGDQGSQGVQGAQGIQGNQGNMGNQGNPGDEGQAGAQGVSGDQGDQGRQGERGLRGKSARPLSRLQALAMFGLIVLIGVVMTWLAAEQASKLASQQREITANAHRIENAQALSCRYGLEIIKQFNDQQDALAKIERELTVKASKAGAVIGRARIKAYEAGRIFPLPECR